ncbi:hypothetical protein BCR34DRAFT_572548 [Clohesyomyces aquaticus]|uniref:DUF1989 domain-containing protein n=1 Tax=Clohesyomyces aquaticus TaxID=1231657 RepID=A0A1Y1Z325_9PLEO|nr:hypothetical protein BCR34DRAFT_572548 [Clohesyomyces aquaticus]
MIDLYRSCTSQLQDSPPSRNVPSCQHDAFTHLPRHSHCDYVLAPSSLSPSNCHFLTSNPTLAMRIAMPPRSGPSPPTHPSPSAYTTVSKTLIPAAHGHAFSLPASSRFRIIDIHGEQVVDLMAWINPNPPSTPTPFTLTRLEKLSTAYTRYHLSGVTPAIGEYLWTNADRPILQVTEDTVKVHDMTFMSCFPGLYEKKGLVGHRSCAENITSAMRKAGFMSTVGEGDGEDKGLLEISGTDPFNCFQNTPNYSLKRLGSSRKGDYVEFEAVEDVVVAVSCCPYDLEGFNGGEITDVAIEVLERN